MAERRTVNVMQVVEMLACSRRHVYNLFHRRDIDGFWNGDGRGLRFYHDSIVEFKENNTPDRD